MVLGPHQAYGNNPRSIEFAVEWVTEFLRYCYDHDITYAKPTKEGVNKWTQRECLFLKSGTSRSHAHWLTRLRNPDVLDCAAGSLMDEVDSWMTGINTNVPGRQTRFVARYSGSNQEFRRWCDEVRRNHYNTLKSA